MSFLASYWWVFLTLSFVFTGIAVVLVMRQFKRFKDDMGTGMDSVKVGDSSHFEVFDSIFTRYLPIILCILADGACFILFLIGIVARFTQ